MTTDQQPARAKARTLWERAIDQPIATRYAVVMVCVVSVAVFRRVLAPSEIAPYPFLGYSIPVVLGAIIGGWRLGLFATASCLIPLSEAMFRGSQGWTLGTGVNLIPMAIFIAEGIALSALGDFARTALASAKQSTDVLESRVQARTAQLEAVNTALAQSNESLQEFASVASHDLQEPLRKIRAFGDRLRSVADGRLEDRGLMYLERMQAASERMSKLIDDLLQYSRVTTKAQPFLEVDLAVLVVEVVDDLEIQIEETGAEVEIGPLPTVLADRSQLSRVFLNLLSNALKFRKPDTPPRIAIAAEQDDPNTEHASTEIRVTDNGIGFDPQYAERIFNVFERLHGRGKYEGTGIGLAVCKKIAERHGGSLTAQSAEGEGSTFVLRLPLEPPPT